MTSAVILSEKLQLDDWKGFKLGGHNIQLKYTPMKLKHVGNFPSKLNSSFRKLWMKLTNINSL